MTLRYREPPKKKTAPKKTGKMGKSDCPEPKAKSPKPKAPKPSGPQKLPAPKPSKPSKPTGPKTSKRETLPAPKPKHPTMGMDYLEWVKRERKPKGSGWGPNMLSKAVREKYKKKKK